MSLTHSALVLSKVSHFLLEVLHLDSNHLTTLPVDFDQLKGLRDLRLHNNPLRTPPMDVCVSGVLQPIGCFIRRALEREGTLKQMGVCILVCVHIISHTSPHPPIVIKPFTNHFESLFITYVLYAKPHFLSGK